MQIYFSSEDVAVICRVTIRVPNCGDAVCVFTSNHWDKFYAGFAADAMTMQMREAIEKMRRDAYEQGWKDAKSKKVEKCTYFLRFWDKTQ